MTPSQACITLVKQFEGCKLKSYLDQRGRWTIGYGCTGGNIGPSTVWAQEMADQELQVRLDAVGRIISQKVVPMLTQNQFDALCSLVYNIGVGAFSNATFLKLLNARDMVGAAKMFPAWDHVDGVVNAGLLRRRLAEQALFNGLPL